MAKTLKILPLLAALGLLAACETGGTNAENAAMGAATGAIIAGATDNDPLIGAAVGGAVGAANNSVAQNTSF